jgi:hypothetical protein
MGFRISPQSDVAAMDTHSSRRAGLESGNGFDLAAKLLLRVPQVICLLHAAPQIGAIAAKLPDTNRHLGRDACVLGQNTVQLLARDPKMLCHVGHADAECGQNILAKDSAGMRRSALRTMGGKLIHSLL